MTKRYVKKAGKLERILRGMGRVMIAFSGGVDSTFLLRFACDCLGSENVVAFVERGPVYPGREIRFAAKFASSLGVKTRMFTSLKLDKKAFSRNSPDRCFHCKHDLFGRMQKTARTLKIKHLLDGSNADDKSDYRPGEKAKKLHGIRSPLQEAGLTKQEIRALSKEMNLPTWNKPAFACLASRIPYGQTITAERLARIGQAEEFLRGQKFSQVRVRDYETLCRIEVDPGDLDRVLAHRHRIVRQLKKIGYLHVALDLEGYSTGSMNRVLPCRASRG